MGQAGAVIGLKGSKEPKGRCLSGSHYEHILCYSGVKCSHAVSAANGVSGIR